MARGLQEVELDDGDAVPGPGAAVAGSTAAADPAGPPRPRARRRLVVVVGALVVGALALAGTQRVLDARRVVADDALAARFADATGVVAPFGADLHAEPVPDRPYLAQDATVQVGSTFVTLLTDPGDGRATFVALDAADGTERWSTAAALERPQPGTTPYWFAAEPDVVGEPGAQARLDALLESAAGQGGDRWCARVPGDAAFVVCGAEVGTPFAGAPLTTTWWVLDVADGTVKRTGSTGPGSWVLPLDDVLVQVEGARADGSAESSAPQRWTVEATDLVSGDVRWTWTTPDGGRDGARAWSGLLGTGAGDVFPQVDVVRAAGGRVLVAVAGTGWVLDRDGTLVADVPVPEDGGLVLARHGGAVPRLATVDADDGLVQQEAPVAVPTDDGTLGDTDFATRVALSTTELVARTVDGTQRWATDRARLPLAVLDGDVLVRTYDGVARLDGADGSVVWSAETGVDGDLAVTDGRTVLVRVGDALRALSWESGRTGWERTFADLGLAGTVHALDVVPGMRALVAHTPDGVLVLR